jgi:hypothetical protein
MRPKVFSFNPVTALLTGYATNVTGATWTLTNTATTDGLGHKITIQNNSVTNHSAKTATVVGTDVDGNAQTETLNLPNTSATVTGVKYFKTVTSVTPSATIGADTMNIGWDQVGVSNTYPVDWVKVTVGGISLGVTITGTINYTVQHTLDEIFASTTAAQTANWFNHSTVASKTASSDGNYAFPVRAIRLMINSVTNGATVSFNILEGRGSY